jgi:hypothetical protein
MVLKTDNVFNYHGEKSPIVKQIIINMLLPFLQKRRLLSELK